MNIVLENLTFRYKSPGASNEPVLNDIDLTINNGEFLAIVGLSGSGKTTMMHHLTGLLRPDAGRVIVDGQNIHHKQFSLSGLRRRLGLVFQFPESQLFAETVFDDVAFGPTNQKLADAVITERVQDALHAVGLNPENILKRSPLYLSGGEKRRVAIAGVLSMNPECLALDEPTAALDESGMVHIAQFLRSFHNSGKTVILVSHNLNLVAGLATRVVVLKSGRIIYDGSVKKMLSNPEALKRAGFPIPRLYYLVNYLCQKNLLAGNQFYTMEQIKLALCDKSTTASKQYTGR